MSVKLRAAVVVPCFNASETIAATVASVQAQTISDWELVVVDDGSTDGSPDIVEAIAAADQRVTLVRQENAGVSSARNAGFAATSAPVIGLIDSDDLWKPHFLETMLGAFEDPEVGAAFSRAEILDAQGISTGVTTNFSDTATELDSLIMTNPAGTCSTLVLRRETIDDVGPFATELLRVEDQHWILKARLGGWSLQGVDDVLVGYRTSGEGLSADLEGMLEGWEAMIELLDGQIDEERVREARAEHFFYLARRSLRLGRSPLTTMRYLKDAFATDSRVPCRKLLRLPVAVVRRFRHEQSLRGVGNASLHDFGVHSPDSEKLEDAA